jgi:hypothetical protein
MATFPTAILHPDPILTTGGVTANPSNQNLSNYEFFFDFLLSP